MNYSRYIISVALLTHTFLACMDTKSSEFFMLIPENQVDQPYLIPFEHTQQCQNIKTGADYKSLPHCKIEAVSGKDVLNFVYYLQNIYNVNQLAKDNTKEQQPFQNRITKQMKSLKTPELLSLFSIVDVMNVIDRSKNSAIVDEVASRVLANLDRINTFDSLNGRALFREVIQKIGKDLNVEKNYIEPYARTLRQRQELDRTVSIFTAIWYNTTNVIAAPVRWFSSASWAIYTIMKPYYLNNKSGTMITGFVQKLDKEDKIIKLLITNKKTKQDITISLADKNINIIKQIEANKDESVFICRSGTKAIIINTLNKENPVIDHSFTDCAFSDKSNQLYFITPTTLGIWDLENNTQSVIEMSKEDKCYLNINSNKDGTKFIIRYGDQQERDQANDEYIDAIWSFKKSTCSTSPFEKKKVFEDTCIENICLHPTEDICYAQYHNDSVIHTVCININTHEITPLAKTIPLAEIFQFIEDSDILFIGTPKIILYQWQNDYFVNTKNGNTWSKEKNKCNEMRLLDAAEEAAIACYERIAVTADGMYAIEQKFEGTLGLDICSIICCIGLSPVNVNFIKTAANPLIDSTIKEIIANLNADSMSLKTIAQMKQTIDDKSYQKAEQYAKTLKSILKPIVAVGAASLGLISKCNINLKKYINISNEKHYRYYISTMLTSCIFGTLLLLFLNQIAAQY